MIIKDGILLKGENKHGKIVIPSSVHTIAFGAFKGCDKITRIIIPDSVINIEMSAFCGCSNLKSINIPYGITEIENAVFSDCNNLKSINIPNSVEEIGESAFENCTNLESINIPNSVEEIGKYAFKNCTNLESINIPNNVINIGRSAFCGCSNLKSINIPYGITEIENAVFYDCNNLKSINIPNSVEVIGEAAFFNCSNLNNINIPDSVVQISYNSFGKCSKLKNINISNRIKFIGPYAFQNCKELENIDISNSIISVDENVFYGCSSLKNINYKTSLFKRNIGHGEKNYFGSTTIYNYELNNDEMLFFKIQKKELLDIIDKTLKLNGINKNNSYEEHKKIIDKIIISIRDCFLYFDYRDILNPYLEIYIKKCNPEIKSIKFLEEYAQPIIHKNNLIKLNKYVDELSNKSIDEVIEILKKLKIGSLSDDASYDEIYNYGKKLNEYPNYISGTFFNVLSQYSKEIKIKQIKQLFDKLTDFGKKKNLFQKIILKSKNDSDNFFNEELLNQLNEMVSNEVLLENEEMLELNKIKELTNIYLDKLKECIGNLDNYSINVSDSVNTLNQTDEQLKVTAQKSRLDELKNIATLTSEKYVQINIAMNNDLIYMSKLNEIKNTLFPKLLKIITSDSITKEIDMINETSKISQMLDEIINTENLNNTNINNMSGAKSK